MKKLWDDLRSGKAALGVVGLGYVGLPLAHAFAKKFRVIGYDFNSQKVALLKKGIDPSPAGARGECFGVPDRGSSGRRPEGSRDRVHD